jgi:hypothetical protein
LLSAITVLQNAVAQDRSCEELQEAASGLTEVVHPWTICQWTELWLASGVPLIYIILEDFHSDALKWSQEEQMQLDYVITQLKSQKLERKHGVIIQIHRCHLACISLLLQYEGDHFAGSRWKEEWDASRFVERLIFRWL